MKNLHQSTFELKHLRALVAVGDALNFHRAAEQLGMSQPAVSRLLRELEERVEAVLVNRTTRTVTLTSAGSYLQAEARDILQRTDLAGQTTRSHAEGAKSLLRITYMTLAGHALVPDIVHLFTKRHPEIKCEMSYLPTPQQQEGIEKGDIHVGFVVGPLQSTEIASRIVANHPLMVLLPAGHRLIGQASITLQDLAQEPLVLGTMKDWPTLRSIIDGVFSSAGLHPQVCQEASSLTGILGLVTAGLAPTIFCGVPRFCQEPAIYARPLITPEMTVVQSNMIWRKNRMTHSLRKFIATADEVAQAYL